MTERFTASNGWYVEDETLHSPSGAPHVWLGKGSKYPYPAGSDATALIEYGRHLERTERDDSDLVHQIAQAIRRNCTAPFGHTGTTDATIAFVADWIETPPAWVKASWVAQEPPKPWLDAQPGDVWVLTLAGGRFPTAYLVDEHGYFQGKDEIGTSDDLAIVAGDCIWPRPEMDAEESDRG